MDGEWTCKDLGFDHTRYPVVPNVAAPAGCPTQHPGGYLCTRPNGHTGRHAATGTGRVVLAVWRQQQPEVAEPCS